MSRNRKCRSILSIILTICMMATLVPNVFAAQSNEYVDPAEVCYRQTTEPTNLM